MIFSRKEREAIGANLPEKWVESVVELLNTTYEAQLSQYQKFQVYGFTYTDEVFLGISLTSEKSEHLPVTYCISSDLTKEQNQEKVLKELVDSIGLFFDGYFEDTDSLEYQSRWELADLKKTSFYYKITREDLALSLVAEKLLNQS